MNGLLLSTPVEIVPILVTYSAVQGSIVFYVPAPTLFTDVYGVASETENSEPISEEVGEFSGTGDSFVYSTRGLDREATRKAGIDGKQSAVGNGDGMATLHLDEVFPGKRTISPVSLRSTARVVASLEEMQSSGHLLHATLTRHDMPGTGSMTSREQESQRSDAKEAFVETGEGGVPVEVRCARIG